MTALEYLSTALPDVACFVGILGFVVGAIVAAVVGSIAAAPSGNVGIQLLPGYDLPGQIQIFPRCPRPGESCFWSEEGYVATRARIIREREASGLPLLPAAIITSPYPLDVEQVRAEFERVRRGMRRGIFCARRQLYRVRRSIWLESLPEKARRVLA